jgi:putative oxidoreductase
MFSDEVPFSDAFGKLLLRLSLGVLVLMHGVAKILHPQAIEAISKHLSDIGLPTTLVYGVYMGEVVAPLMLIFGVFSRVAGALVTVNMIFALVLVHRTQLLLLTSHGGWQLELQWMYLACGLVIAFIGGGRFALVKD